MSDLCVCGIKSILEKNKFYLGHRSELNEIVEQRVLSFREDDIFGTLRIMEHYAGGKIIPIEIDDVSCLQKLVNNLKRGASDEEKDERIKKMGIKISELNKKLQEKQ